MNHHVKDPREPVFRKVGKRYVQCGRIDTPYLRDKTGQWESTRKDGLWLHTSGDGWKAMTCISTLEDLPLPVTQLAGLFKHREELVQEILSAMHKPVSAHDLATLMLTFVSKLQSVEPS
jgi:hypothetical protein